MIYKRLFYILINFYKFLLAIVLLFSPLICVFFKIKHIEFAYFIILIYTLVISLFLERIIIEKDKECGYFIFLKQHNSSIFVYLLYIVILSQILLSPMYIILFTYVKSKLIVGALLLAFLNFTLLISAFSRKIAIFLFPLLFFYFKIFIFL